MESDSGGGAGIGCFMDEGGHWAVIRHNKIKINTSSSDGFSAFGAGMSVLSNAIITNNIIEHNSCTNTFSQTDGAGIEVEEWLVPGISAEIRDNTVRYNTLNGKTDSWGAGISVHYVSDVLIEGNIISDNTGNGTSYSWGGGIFVMHPDQIKITENLIENNTLNADRTSGGGIFLGETANVQIENNTFNNNSCNSQQASWGGGIFCYQSDTIEILNNTFEKNECNSASSNAGGGGINLNSCGKTKISDNEISENLVHLTTGTNYWGGGILIDRATDTVIIQYNFIDKNSLTNGNGNNGHGGGISFYCVNDIVAYVNGNKLTNNYSDYRGGGLCSRNFYRSFIQNNLFKGNDCYKYGGAMMLNKTSKNENAVSHPLVVNNTFLDNTTENGGAIYSYMGENYPVILNNIFWNNAADYYQDIFNTVSYELPVYHNLIDTDELETPWTGEGNMLCDPELMDDSLHLDLPSMCVNAGISVLELEGVWYPSPNTDIDGEVRPYMGTKPDLGADEAQWLYVAVEEVAKTEEVKLKTYPNPFSGSTTIEYQLEKSSNFQLLIYNHLGEQVEQITEYQPQGKHQFTWHAENLPAGVYYCVLKTNYGTQTTKMIKLK